MTEAERTRTQAKIDRYNIWYGSNIEGPSWLDEGYRSEEITEEGGGPDTGHRPAFGLLPRRREEQEQRGAQGLIRAFREGCHAIRQNRCCRFS